MTGSRSARLGGATVLAVVPMLAVTLAAPARAQAPASVEAPAVPAVPAGPPAAEIPAAPTTSQPAAAPDAPPAPSAPQDLDARLQETDQIARIADRKLELLEEKLDKAAKEAVVAGADDKGFVIRSANKQTSLQVRGLVQTDTRWFFGNDTVANNVSFIDNDTFILRRFRPELAGTVLGLADFVFSPDFAGAAVTVFDAYLDVHPFPWLRLRIGKQKTPLGLERLQSEGTYPFIERALDQNLTPGRDVGAALWGELAGGIVTYNAGVWNGFPDGGNNSGGAAPDGDTNHAKDFIARLLVQPLKTVEGAGSLGVGLAAGTGNRKGRPPVAGGLPLVTTYRSAGQLAIFSYAVGPATDTAGALTVFAHLRETHVNPQLYYYYGPIGLLAEYVWARQGLQKGNVTAELTNTAYHVSASYVLGGTASYEGAAPTHPFNPAAGHFGALELAARYDALKIDDHAFDRSDPAGGSYGRGFANPITAVSRAASWTGALVYSPSRALRFFLNYERTTFEDGGAADATTKLATDRKTESLLFARAHLRF